MQHLGHLLLGDPQTLSFDKRIFHVTILTGAIVNLAVIALNAYDHLPIHYEILALFCWLLTYYLSRFKDHFHIVSKLSLAILVFVLTPYIWLSSPGSEDVVRYYAILFASVICMIAYNKFRLMMVVSLLLVNEFLVLLTLWKTETPSLSMIIKDSFPLMVMTGAISLITIVYSNTYRSERAKRESYAQTITSQYREQLYYMENLEELIQRLKSERHDFNNHIGILFGLIETGDTSSAKAYSQQLIQVAKEHHSLVNIPYSMVRALLNYKLSLAIEAHIQVDTDIHLPPDLPVNEYDLSVIIGNLIDNAMEASMALDAEERFIRLTLTYKPSYLLVYIENNCLPISQHQGGSYPTSKADEDNHGFGLKNIEYVVNQHNGFMKIMPEGNRFMVHVALLLN